MAAEAAPSARRGLASRLLGHDIFLSFALGPPPRGSRAYTADLARRLRELDFTVFFSEEEAPAGGRLDATLRRALRRSRVLVVVMNPATLRDPRWVRAEVEEFRRVRPGGLIVPISIGGALSDPELSAMASAWLPHEDIIWVDETEAAWREGVASADVLARLATAPHSLRVATLWRSALAATLVAFASIALVAWLQRQEAVDSEKRAREELARATALRMAAESDAMLAGLRSGGDRRALLQLAAALHLSSDAETLGTALAALQRHSDLVRLVELPAAGTQLTLDEAAGRFHVAVQGRGVLAFSWPNGHPLPGIETDPQAQFRALAVGGEGRLLAAVTTAPSASAAGGGRTVARVWELATRRPAGPELPFERDGVAALAFAPSGTELWAAVGAQLRRVDIASGQLLEQHTLDLKTPYPEGTMTLSSLQIVPEGGRVVGGGYYGPSRRALVVWRMEDGGVAASRLSEQHCDTSVVRFTSDRRRVLAGGGYADFDNALCAFDATSLLPLAGPAKALAEPVSAFGEAPDGRSYAVATEGGRLARFSSYLSGTAELVQAREPHRGMVAAVLLSKGEPLRVLTAARDGTVRVWRWDDLGEGLAAPTKRWDQAVDQVRFDWGGTLHAGDAGGQVAQYMRDPRTGLAGGLRVMGDAGFADCIAHSPDGQTVYALQRGRLVISVRATGAATGPTLADAPADASCLALSPDGTLLAAGARDGSVAAWELPSGRRAWSMKKAHDKAVNAMRFSTNGSFVVTGGADGRLLSFASIGGAPAQPAMQSDTAIGSLDIDPSSTFLATSHGTTLRWWHLPSGRPIGAPASDPMSEWISGATFSADGSVVRAYTRGRYPVREWPSPSRWLGLLCDKLAQDMTRDEWQAWVSPQIAYRPVCPAR